MCVHSRIIPGHHFAHNSDLRVQLKVGQKLGEGFVTATVAVFQGWANKIHKLVRKQDGKMHLMWIFSAPFFSMRHIYHPRYLNGDKTLPEKTLE